jgi:hypothetical protein
MTISETKEISPEKLRSLASAAPPCITIVLPEHEGRDARIAFKDALVQVRAQLEGCVPRYHIASHDIASFLAPLEAEAAAVIDSTKGPATFIFVRSPDVCESFRTRYLIGQPIAAVDEGFHMRPLLALASKRLDFYILALSLNHTRILKCTDESFEPARFPRNAGTEAAGIVPGASQAEIHAKPVHDRDHPDDQLGHFYREVDRDVNALLKDGHPPLVVAGTEHEVALFYRLTTYPACVKPGIHGLPDRLTDDEVYRLALESVRSVTTGKTNHALENFDKKVGTGHASPDIQVIADAASGGRVEHMFLRENASASESFEAGSDLFDKAAAQTLRHGGDVRILPEALMPGGATVCAIFRYASADRQAVNGGQVLAG